MVWDLFQTDKQLTGKDLNLVLLDVSSFNSSILQTSMTKSHRLLHLHLDWPYLLSGENGVSIVACWEGMNYPYFAETLASSEVSPSDKRNNCWPTYACGEAWSEIRLSRQRWSLDPSCQYKQSIPRYFPQILSLFSAVWIPFLLISIKGVFIVFWISSCGIGKLPYTFECLNIFQAIEETLVWSGPLDSMVANPVSGSNAAKWLGKTFSPTSRASHLNLGNFVISYWDSAFVPVATIVVFAHSLVRGAFKYFRILVRRGLNFLLLGFCVTVQTVQSWT